MNLKLLSIFFILLLFSSCGVIKKTLHPSQFCVEPNCHNKRMPESIYCKAHYTLEMYEIVGKAEKAKKDAEVLDKNKN